MTFVARITQDRFTFAKQKIMYSGAVVRWEGGRGLNSKFHFLTNFTTTHFN